MNIEALIVELFLWSLLGIFGWVLLAALLNRKFNRECALEYSQSLLLVNGKLARGAR